MRKVDKMYEGELISTVKFQEEYLSIYLYNGVDRCTNAPSMTRKPKNCVRSSM
jgi:hypothetical protein